MVQCCFTSTETIRLIRTATSTFTQLLNSEIFLPDIRSDNIYIWGDGVLFFGRGWGWGLAAFFGGYRVWWHVVLFFG